MSEQDRAGEESGEGRSSEQIDLLRRHPLFAGLDAAILGELVRYAVVRRFGHGELIFRHGDAGNALYGILGGRVRIFTPGPGNGEITLNLMEPGELFGEIAAIDGKPRTASAIAMEGTTLLQLRRDAMLHALKQHPAFAEAVILLLCDRLRWTSDLIEDTAFLPLPARLAKRLLAFGVTAGGNTARGDPASGERDRVRLSLSQRELATLVGASRESVNKLLSQWRAQGLVELQRQRLLLIDLPGLARIAGGTAEAA